jgi:hypothetical protein
MSEERLTPERAVRLLRAKAGELEHRFLTEEASLDVPMTTLGANMMINGLMADIALVCSILADFMETADPTLQLYVAHSENLIERVASLEDVKHLHTKTGKVLTDDDIQALADEAERGYDVSHLRERHE